MRKQAIIPAIARTPTIQPVRMPRLRCNASIVAPSVSGAWRSWRNAQIHGWLLLDVRPAATMSHQIMPHRKDNTAMRTSFADTDNSVGHRGQEIDVTSAAAGFPNL